MIRIPCPHCGLRDHSEFTYLGDAGVRRPSDPDESDPQQWFDYIYYRDNPRGKHRELWHHGHGCRAWLVVTRDTLTHEVFDACLAQKPARESDGGENV